MDEADRPHRHDLRAVGAAHHQPLRGQALSPGLFRFVQVELAWPLGPPPGRHVLRAGPDAGSAGEDRPITHVIVLGATPDGARAAARGLRRPGARRARPRAGASTQAPQVVPLGRATVISVRDPFPDPVSAGAWLQRAGDAELGWGLALIGELLHAHRIATADPWLVPPTRERVLAARAGFGAGEEVADGRFTAARELEVATGGRRGRRRRSIADAEARLAALLAGSEHPLACEELVLRARLDLDSGRPREAALQLLIALDAAVAELSGLAARRGAEDGTGLPERVAALRDRRAPAAAAAQAALSGPPSAAAQEEVARTIAMLEAVLRAR